MNPNIIQSIYIDVQTSKGMFSTELAVTIKLHNGREISIFADKGLLKEENGNWKLKVTPIKKNSHSQVVLLPTEAFETSTRWAEVSL